MKPVKADPFNLDKKLGIKIPHFEKDWDVYTMEEQLNIIRLWEHERAKIPDRIKEIEHEIIEKQELMYDMDFDEYCNLHKEIVDMASAINDLNIWFRTDGHITK